MTRRVVCRWVTGRVVCRWVSKRVMCRWVTGRVVCRWVTRRVAIERVGDVGGWVTENVGDWGVDVRRGTRGW